MSAVRDELAAVRYSTSQAAAEWFLRFQSGELTGSERIRYVHWLKESPEHVSEMLSMCRIHSMLRAQKRAALDIDDEDWGTVTKVPLRKRQITRRRELSDIAAAISCGVGSVGLLWGVLQVTHFQIDTPFGASGTLHTALSVVGSAVALIVGSIIGARAVQPRAPE